MTITKKDLAHAVAKKLDFPNNHTLAAVQEALDTIIELLASGERIELRNFGVFETRLRQPRQGRNPRTGESVNVPAKRVVVFKPGKTVANRVAASGKAKKKKAKRAS
jgi:nucleoid DNA-binding protein